MPIIYIDTETKKIIKKIFKRYTEIGISDYNEYRKVRVIRKAVEKYLNSL